MPPSLRERLLARTSAVPTGGLGRAWRTGRASAAIARAIAKGDADFEDVARLVLSLGELKGVAIKAGQMLGYLDPTLPEPVRAAMAVLQTAAPALANEFGVAKVGVSFAERFRVLPLHRPRAPSRRASHGVAGPRGLVKARRRAASHR
jgi:hypothetical protein